MQQKCLSGLYFHQSCYDDRKVGRIKQVKQTTCQKIKE